MQVAADDPDVNGQSGMMDVSMVVTFPQPQYFDVRPVSNGNDGHGPWEIYSLESFDREDPLPGYSIIEGRIKYPVTIKVTDRDSRQPLSATCFFFVEIEDVNDQVCYYILGAWY